jgi:putative membrane protein
MGLIAGSLPFIFKNLRLKGKPKAPHAALVGIAIALVIMLSFINAPPETAETATEHIALIAVSSFCAAAAMIIPGISGAFMLLLFGTYYNITNGLRSLDFSVIIPALIGIAAGAVLGARGIRFLLTRCYTATYSVITGLVIGSLWAIFPAHEFALDLSFVAGICTFGLGMAMTLAAGRK